ncbi:MAG: DUF2971 domain-containing protein [Desulfobulbaceae bacterium]|nr:DUF2971 domain-containing protein [Desulfobulbaceae bacterium]
MRKVKEVHGFTKEEKLLHNCATEEYFNNLRQCNKYHYTDIEGIIGILTNGTLWLTHSSGLNDISEGKLLLSEAASDLQRIKPDLQVRFNSEIASKLFDFYSCSFSSYANLLSQWRGYGDIALGFDWDLLRFPQAPIKIIDDSGCQTATSGLDFVRCNYIDPSDKHTYRTAINKIIDHFLSTFDGRDPDIHEIQYCALTIGANTTCAKHIGFFEEAEHRIVHYWWNIDAIQHPTTKKLRLEYKFREDSIKNIVIGPCQDQEEKLTAIQQLLDEFDPAYKNVEVCRSMIPFIKQ